MRHILIFFKIMITILYPFRIESTLWSGVWNKDIIYHKDIETYFVFTI